MNFIASLLAGATLMLGGIVSALAQTWDGETNTNWGTGTNWSGDSVPAVTGTVLVNNGSLANQPSILAGDNFSAQHTGISAGSLTIEGSLLSTVTVSNSGSFIVQSGGVLDGNVTTTGGAFSNYGVITGNVTTNGGIFNNFGVVLGSTVLGGSVGGTVSGQIRSWEGGTNTNWGTGTNWSGNSVPTVTGTVLVNGGGLANQPRILASDNFSAQHTAITAGSLTIEGSLLSTVTVGTSGSFIIQSGGVLDGNVTNDGGTVNNSGVVTGTVTNAGTLHASNGASFDDLSNAGLFDLDGGATNIVGTLTLGSTSMLSVQMADYASGGLPIMAGDAELGGVLVLDFSSILFIDDFWAFDLIRVGGNFTGDFSGFQVSGLAPDLSFSTSKLYDSYTVIVERGVTTPVPEPETYAMLLAGLALLGFAARRRKQKEAALA
ncbi:MAG: PEP-CTERM sorting domain-containing protein [Burkholderiales bacterium]